MRLPFFPLHTVLFPHMPLPLQIFEERYRAMTRDLLAEESPYAGRFMVSMITDGAEVGDHAGHPPLTGRIGTIAEVRSADQLADGRWVLLAVGLVRAELLRVERGAEYALAEVVPLPDEPIADADLGRLLPLTQAALDRYLATVKRYVASTASKGRGSQETSKVVSSLDEVLKPIKLPDDAAAASYAVAGVLQIELRRKQQLLDLPDAAARLTAEIELLRREAELLADQAMAPMASADLHYHPN
jgi:uncharacterized protein